MPSIKFLVAMMLVFFVPIASAAVVEYNGTTQYTTYYADTDYTLVSQLGDIRIANGYIANWIVGYPYIKNGSPNRLDFKISVVGNPYLIMDNCSNVTIQFGSDIYNLTYDNTTFTWYGVFIFSNATEEEFTVRAEYQTTNFNVLKDSLLIKQWRDIELIIWEDDNKTKQFNDGYNYVLFIPYRDKTSPIMQDWAKSALWLTNINDKIERRLERELQQEITLFEADKLQEYRYGVFHNGLVNGYTKIEVPSDVSYVVRLIKVKSNQDVVFSTTRYATMYFSHLIYDVMLSEKLKISTDAIAQYVVTQRDTYPVVYYLSWFLYILGFFIIIAIPYFIYKSTNDVPMTVKTMVALIVAIPAIIEVIKLLVK